MRVCSRTQSRKWKHPHARMHAPSCEDASGGGERTSASMAWWTVVHAAVTARSSSSPSGEWGGAIRRQRRSIRSGRGRGGDSLYVCVSMLVQRVCANDWLQVLGVCLLIRACALCARRRLKCGFAENSSAKPRRRTTGRSRRRQQRATTCVSVVPKSALFISTGGGLSISTPVGSNRSTNSHERPHSLIKIVFRFILNPS